ncbi:tectonic-2 isoform X2 [Varanus komodoensis]|uniref:tectonic-2 isoform X2 n=1 Tax=Varanus komodoensis TaxID=61221 RepID=UPI001CF7B281|nr:tectonic-2 isoform X2 [Varanus komodoensis]
MLAWWLLWGLLLGFGARAQDGKSDFQPPFILMSGTTVTASLAGSLADVFSLAVVDNETGLLPSEDCSGRNRTGDWSLNVTYQVNISRVTVHLNKTPHLCTENLTSCCSEEPCVLEALQVSACHGLKVVARLLIQAKIYANTSLGNMTGKTEDNATVIPNQVFQPLGSCPCNLTAGACDIRCCCDLECSSEMKQLFSGSCFRGVFGGDVNPPFDQMCSAHPGSSAPDWFPFLCVQSSLDNTPFLGYFYQGALSSREVSSFKIPFQTIPGKLFSGYKQGDPILNMQNEYFTIPQQFLAGQCARNAPIAFLRNVEAKCLATCKEAGSSMLDRAINSGTGDAVKPQVTKQIKLNVGSCAGTECRDTTFAEDYTIIWEGKRIIEIKVKVLTGVICSEEVLMQKFTVSFVSVNASSTEELSGNPGYQVGKPIRAANLNSSDLVTTLNLWKPDGKGSCASAGLTPLLFGLNSVSGCIEEVDLKDSCSQLRENVAKRLNSLVEVSHVGKRGNSNASVLDDWVEIIRLDTLGPNTNESFENLKGTCPDIPAHLNIQIITADVGAVEGIPQQEILGVQLSFSMVTWQVQCPIICEDKTSTLPISVAVQFIKIPVQPPVPMTRFQINYTEYDCRRNDVCWPELFYPLTRYYTGEPYSHSLAKGLVLVFFILIGVVLSVPWRND